MYDLGTMDGWHGDEYICDNNCGLCEDCEQHYYESCDADYEENAE